MILSHDEARAFYDRFGAKQDLQRFYEDPAISVLLAHADFEHAAAVIELGCGTGRFAETLLRTRLPPCATYLGIDISTTMVELARTRLRPRARLFVLPLEARRQARQIVDRGRERSSSSTMIPLHASQTRRV